jgi:hypothetical protein
MRLAASWHLQSISVSKNSAAATTVLPDRPAAIGELIRVLLAHGYTMAMIRAMYPGLFL